MAMKLLAIPGSLRSTSSNAALLRAAARVAPAGTELVVYDGLGGLPHFSPDLDVEPVPETVAALRAQIGAVDALAISSPEYAHGMPGSLKNALDWLVGSGELYDMPVAVVSVAPSPERGERARRWVEEVVGMQGGHVVDSFTVTATDDPSAVLMRVIDAFELARR
jgi:NAD(P)H-dependent FMN reductase